MIVDLVQFMAATGAVRSRAEPALQAANNAMALYGIDTRQRIAMFLANVGHETGGLKWLKEIWGSTAQQLRYDGRADLGNKYEGDGKRYMGRGWLQTTGRANYAQLRDRLHKRGLQCPDFEASPESLEQPEWGAISATDYVDMRNLNRFADRGAFVDYVKGVNGGTNGLEDRVRLYNAALKALV